jgi:serine acetyltransferase-like protein
VVKFAAMPRRSADSKRRSAIPGAREGAPEIAASRQRGTPADEGKLWETLRLDAERAAAGEEMLSGFLDLAVLRHDGIGPGLGLLLAHKAVAAPARLRIRRAPDRSVATFGYS